MGSVQTWGEAITMSLIGLWERFVSFLPSLLGALLVFFFGLVVAVALGKVAEKFIALLRIDQIIGKMSFGDYCSKLLNRSLAFRVNASAMPPRFCSTPGHR